MVTTLPIDVPKSLHLEVNTFSSSLVCHRFFFLILGAPKNGTADFAPKQHQVTSRSRFSRLPTISNKSKQQIQATNQWDSLPAPSRKNTAKETLHSLLPLKLPSNKSMGQMPAMVQEQHQPIQIVQRLKRHQDL